MTFGDIESSRQEAIPYLLMLFTYGSNVSDTYAYTTSEDPIVYNGITYVPAPLSDDAFTASGSLDKAAIDIKLSKSLSILELFTGDPPSNAITISVFMGHYGDSNANLIWPGRVRSAAINDDEITLTCEPISTSMMRSGLRRHWQRPCPHAVYSQGDGLCNASQAAFTVSAAVTSVSGPYIALPGGWNGAFAQGNFVNGIVSWTNAAGRTEYRMILTIDNANQICLDSDCPTLSAGMTLHLSLGCDHSTDTCQNVFKNINNFGGCQWIPLVNPIGIVNNFG